MTTPLLLLSVSLLLTAKTSSAHINYFDPGAIHFPLRDVRQSINLDTFVASEHNVTVGKCEQVSDQRVVLNLPSLGMDSPPNPYPGFIDSKLATCLNLASNNIFQVVPGSFDSLPRLSYLDLSKNRIQFCDFFNFGSPHPTLVTLIIEENRPPIDNIDKTIGKADCFPSLRYLYLRRNSIHSLNFSLRRSFPVLTHLFLSDNSLDTQTFIHDLPTTLTHLYLENNLISGLDCKIIKDLQALHLDGNIIRSICYRRCQDTSLKLEGVHKLTSLTVSRNRITDIESCAFQDAQGLVTLNLAENNIEEIKRETLERLTSLKELNLDDNHLRNVPNLCNNNQLTSLSLRRNKLQTIRRDSFKNLRSLKCLLLGGNQIKGIEAGALEDLESLAELDLSNNGLDFIPSDWLKWQWNLRTLDVRGNRFKCLEQMSLGAAPFLSTIHMQNNPVTSISGTTVSKLAPNVVIHLQHDCGDRAHGRSDCYARCDETEARARNETYSRWVNNL